MTRTKTQDRVLMSCLNIINLIFAFFWFVLGVIMIYGCMSSVIKNKIEAHLIEFFIEGLIFAIVGLFFLVCGFYDIRISQFYSVDIENPTKASKVIHYLALSGLLGQIICNVLATFLLALMMVFTGKILSMLPF